MYTMNKILNSKILTICIKFSSMSVKSWKKGSLQEIMELGKKQSRFKKTVVCREWSKIFFKVTDKSDVSQPEVYIQKNALIMYYTYWNLSFRSELNVIIKFFGGLALSTFSRVKRVVGAKHVWVCHQIFNFSEVEYKCVEIVLLP